MGSEERRKSKVIGVRVYDLEEIEIKLKAEEAGLSVPSYIRQTVLENIAVTKTRKSPPPLDVRLFSSALGQLGKIGNNLNQIAKRLNEGGGVGIDRIFTALEQLHFSMNELLKAIKARNDNQGEKS